MSYPDCKPRSPESQAAPMPNHAAPRGQRASLDSGVDLCPPVTDGPPKHGWENGQERVAQLLERLRDRTDRTETQE